MADGLVFRGLQLVPSNASGSGNPELAMLKHIAACTERLMLIDASSVGRHLCFRFMSCTTRQFSRYHGCEWQDAYALAVHFDASPSAVMGTTWHLSCAATLHLHVRAWCGVKMLPKTAFATSVMSARSFASISCSRVAAPAACSRQRP